MKHRRIGMQIPITIAILVSAYLIPTADFGEIAAGAELASPAGFEVFVNGERVLWESEQAYIDGENRIQITAKAFFAFEKYGLRLPEPTTESMGRDSEHLALRAVLEAQGAQVAWNGQSRRVDVTTGGGWKALEIDGPQGVGEAAEQMTVHFIDVGQGDSAFIDYGEFEVLIDAGGNLRGAEVVAYIAPYVDGPLDVVVATHPHEDHIGGMDTVLDAYAVTRLIDSGDSWDTKSYRDYYTAATTEPDSVYTPDEDMKIDLGGGASLEILDIVDGTNSINDNSVIALLNYGETDVLFMGDAGSRIEQTGLARFPQVDVLKVGHHGSNTASSQSFLSAVKPKIAIVSASLNNKYGHPNKRVMQRLAAAGATAYGTFHSGTITLTTDGRTYRISGATTLSAITEENAGTIQMTTENIRQDIAYKFVGDQSTSVYHVTTCIYAAKIKEANQVYFASRDEAELYGYGQCGWCALLQEVLHSIY